MEVIVLDDQSTDGCCDCLPNWVKVIRPAQKLGCPLARMRLEIEASGDVLVWTDPHCEFDESFLRVIETAAEYRGVVQPSVDTVPSKGRRYGAKWTITKRGIDRKRISKRHEGVAQCDALYGGIYACRRDVWKDQLGWLPLPGVTGSQDNGLSLLCAFAGVGMWCDSRSKCKHWQMEAYSGLPKREHPYPWTERDRVLNNVGVHWAFFREHWGYWASILNQWLPTQDGGQHNLREIVELDTIQYLRGFVNQRRAINDTTFCSQHLPQIGENYG